MALDAALGRLGIKPGVCTSSTRPANPFEGQVIYETDTNNIRFWSGSAWESNKGGIVSSSAPTGAAAGDIWYDSDDGRAYIYYDDGSSQQWVEFGAPPVQHGKILQVVQTVKTDVFSASQSAGTAVPVTGLTVSITPSSTANKVLVFADISGSNTFGRQGMVLTRGGSTLTGSIGDSAGSRSSVTASLSAYGYQYATGQTSVMYLDSPASTSSLTYGVSLVGLSSGTHFVNRQRDDTDAVAYMRTASFITVMEVSA